MHFRQVCYSYVMSKRDVACIQSRVAPEGEGLCTRHILISHDIIDLCHVFSNGIGFLCMRITKNRILEYYNVCLV